jgi:hypothetical protein
MNQLIERVLAIGLRLSPVDGAGVGLDLRAIERDVLAVALHRQLLQIGREALEVLIVWKDCDRLGAEEVVVPDAQQAHDHWKIVFEWRGAEVPVHLMEAVEHGAEILRADREHRREADRRIHRITPADPIPKLKHVSAVDAELGHFLRIRRDGHKMLRHGLFIAIQSSQRPGAGGLGIGHRFKRGESLGRDDEQCLGWVQIANGLGEVRVIDVGDETESQTPPAERVA